MTELQETLGALWELQTVDSQIMRLKRGQAALDTGQDAGMKASALRETATRELAELHRLSGELKDSELKLQGLESKLKTNQQRLFQGTASAKELINIERETGALHRQRSDLDEQILALMDQVEEQRVKSSAASGQANLAETHHATTLSSWRAKFDASAQEIEDLERRRGPLAGCVPDKALLKKYEDLRARSGGVGVARINGNSCGVCGMTLPSTVIKIVKDGSALATCENCDRILTAA